MELTGQTVARTYEASEAAQNAECHKLALGRIASLERLIRQERAQYSTEQRRAAAEIGRLKSQLDGGGDVAALRKRLASAEASVKELSRYKRQVERLEASPLYGPAYRIWRRFRRLRGY